MIGRAPEVLIIANLSPAGTKHWCTEWKGPWPPVVVCAAFRWLGLVYPLPSAPAMVNTVFWASGVTDGRRSPATPDGQPPSLRPPRIVAMVIPTIQTPKTGCMHRPACLWAFFSMFFAYPD